MTDRRIEPSFTAPAPTDAALVSLLAAVSMTDAGREAGTRTKGLSIRDALADLGARSARVFREATAVNATGQVIGVAKADGPVAVANVFAGPVSPHTSQ